MPGIVLGDGNGVVNKADNGLVFTELTLLWR